MLRELASRRTLVFLFVWSTQLLSMVGSGLTSFALGLWVVERCQAATPFALIALFTMLPTLVMAPVAGVVVDRLDRRLVMLLSDAGAGFAAVAVALLLGAGELEVWHVYLIAAANGLFAAFQQPAYLAATTQLVPADQLGRAAGLVQVAQAATDVLAPLLAGVLILAIRLRGVVLVDLATFVAAALCLLLVRFPGLPSRPGGEPQGRTAVVRSALRETAAGWSFIASRPGLVALLALFAATNFASGTIGALLVPMLATMASADAIGGVVSVAGAGMLLGSLVMSAWGGPRRRVAGVTGFTLLKGLGIVLMGLRPSTWLVALGATVAHFAIPFAKASDQAIWQTKVPPALQGRVFAARHLMARAAMPLAFLLAGPLSDRLFEPFMAAAGSPLAARAQLLLGAGPGRGMGLLFILMGALIVTAAVAGFVLPQLRGVDVALPDAIVAPPSQVPDGPPAS